MQITKPYWFAFIFLLYSHFDVSLSVTFDGLSCHIDVNNDCEFMQKTNTKTETRFEPARKLFKHDVPTEPMLFEIPLEKGSTHEDKYCVSIEAFYIEPYIREIFFWAKHKADGYTLLTARHEFITGEPTVLQLELSTDYIIFKIEAFSKWIELRKISSTAGPCKPQLDCTFELGEPCAWQETHESDSFFFKQSIVLVTSSVHEDVTTDSLLGHVLEIGSTNQNGINKVARYTSPAIASSTSQMCFTFYYHNEGSVHNSLDLRPYYAKSKTYGPILWFQSKEKAHVEESEWHKIQVTLDLIPNEDVHLEFKATQLHKSSLILDEFTFKAGPCTKAPECDFSDNSFCSFRQESNSDASDYRFVIPSFKSDYLIPSDYSKKQNWYELVEKSQKWAIIDFSLAEVESDKQDRVSSELTSGLFNQEKASCMSLQYYFYAAQENSGKLTIKYTEGRHQIVLFEENQVNWEQVEFTLPPGHNMHISIQAEAYLASNSPLFAISNIKNVEGECTRQGEMVSEFTCNFDESICDYQYPSGVLRWMHSLSSTKHHPLLPLFDANEKSTGGYMYVLIDEKVSGEQIVVLNSSIYKPDERNKIHLYCLSFAYQMHYTKKPEFKVALNDQMLHSIESISNSRWIRKQFTFSHRGELRIQFIADLSPKGKSMIALDEIYVHTGSCNTLELESQRHVCDFESSNGGWTPQHTHEQPHFKMTLGGNLNPPVVDHSLLKFTGGLSALQMHPNTQLKYSATLKNFMEYDYSKGICVSFWLNLNADNLHVSLQTIDTDKTENQIQNWWRLKAQPAIKTWLPFSAQIEPKAIENGYIQFAVDQVEGSKTDKDTWVALDDIEIRQGACEYICTFNSDDCEWTPYFKSDFVYLDKLTNPISSNEANTDWDLLTFNLLPEEVKVSEIEYELESNFLALIMEPEANSKVNQIALLRSTLHTFEVTKSNSLCLSFKYFLTDSVYDLSVLIAEKPNDSPMLLHKITPESIKLNQWNHHQFQFEAKSLSLQLGAAKTIDQAIFYLMASPNKKDVSLKNQLLALTNIQLTSDVCRDTHEKFVCDHNVQHPMEKRCDFVFDCEDHSDERDCGECVDFSDGQCGYKSVAQTDDQNHDKLPWTYYSKSDQSAESISTFGRLSLKKGYFEVLTMKTDYFLLQSELLSNTHTYCELQLDYIAVNIFFYVKIENEGGWTYLYEDDLNANSKSIKTIKIQIGEYNQEKFRIKFVARRPYNLENEDVKSGVLINRAQLVNCYAPPKAECKKHQFKCQNGACIDANLLCDLNNDCGDRSDEAKCSSTQHEQCNFNQGTCQLTTISNFKTVRPIDTVEAHAYRDHTRNSPTDFYLKTKQLSDYTKASEVALPLLIQSGDCQIRWFQTGKNVKNITLMYTKEDEEDEVFLYDIPLPKDNYWERQVITLNDISKEFNFFMSRVRVHLEEENSEAYFAMDDFSVNRECYPYQLQEMKCNFGEQTSDGLCMWLLNARNDLVFGQVMRTETNKHHPLFGLEQQRLEMPYLLIRPLEFNEDGKQIQSELQKQEQDFEDGFVIGNEDEIKPCDRCFEIKSPLLTVSGAEENYMTIKYSIFGSEHTRLDIHTGDPLEPLFQDREASSTAYRERCIPIKQIRGSQFHLYINAEINQLNSYVIIKSVSFNTGTCPVVENEPCSFDKLGECNAISQLGILNDFKSSQTTSSSQRDLIDHTRHSRSSAYVYAESEIEANYHFLLEEFKTSGLHCLSFWFTSGLIQESEQTTSEVYGDLIVARFNDEQDEEILFKTSINRQFDWQLVSLELEAQRFDNLQIKANFKGKDNFLIALDDLLMEDRHCFMSFNCDFDNIKENNGMCGWHSQFGLLDNMNVQPPKWLHMFAKQLDIDSFPKSDLDRNNPISQGFMFAYLPPTSRKSVRLIGPLKQINPENQCLGFAYYIPTNSKILLKVNIEQSDKVKTLMSFKPADTQRNKWHLIKMDLLPIEELKSKPEDYDWSTIVFEAVNENLDEPKTKMDPIDNAISIDDIHLYDFPCAEMLKTYDLIDPKNWMNPDFEIGNLGEGGSGPSQPSTTDSPQGQGPSGASPDEPPESSGAGPYIAVVAISCLLATVAFFGYRYRDRFTRQPKLELPRVSMANILQNEHIEY